jgi:hypothetical protein
MVRSDKAVVARMPRSGVEAVGDDDDDDNCRISVGEITQSGSQLSVQTKTAETRSELTPALPAEPSGTSAVICTLCNLF